MIILARPEGFGKEKRHALETWAAHLEPDRAVIEAHAARLGPPFGALWLLVDQTIAIDRVAARQGDASDATPDVVERQFATGAGTINWQVIEARCTVEA